MPDADGVGAEALGGAAGADGRVPGSTAPGASVVVACCGGAWATASGAGAGRSRVRVRRLRRRLGRLALFADDPEHGADFGDLVLVHPDLEQHAGGGGGDFGVDLVGGHLEEWLVGVDAVTDRLEPAGDGAFGDAFPEGRESDFGRHVEWSLLRG